MCNDFFSLLTFIFMVCQFCVIWSVLDFSNNEQTVTWIYQTVFFSIILQSTCPILMYSLKKWRSIIIFCSVLIGGSILIFKITNEYNMVSCSDCIAWNFNFDFNNRDRVNISLDKPELKYRVGISDSTKVCVTIDISSRFEIKSEFTKTQIKCLDDSAAQYLSLRHHENQIGSVINDNHMKKYSNIKKQMPCFKDFKIINYNHNVKPSFQQSDPRCNYKIENVKSVYLSIYFLFICLVFGVLFPKLKILIKQHNCSTRQSSNDIVNLNDVNDLNDLIVVNLNDFNDLNDVNDVNDVNDMIVV